MSAFGDLPEFVYLDEPRVSQRMQIVHNGRINEIVETYGESSEKTSGGGLNIYKILKYNREHTSVDSEELARTIQSTPLGQFAVFYGLIEEEVGIENISLLSNERRSQLSDGDYVTITGKIQESPITKFMRLSEKYGVDLRESLDAEGRQTKNDVVLSELEDSRGYHQMDMAGEVNGRYVFNLYSEGMQDIATDFPSQFTDYTIFGRVEHLFEGSERKYHFSIIDEVNTGSRKEMQENRRKMKRLANEFDDVFSIDVDESMFYIESPDILISPIAIFS